MFQVPSWIKIVAPKGSLEIHEEAWNAYPYCKTVLSNPGYMKVLNTSHLNMHYLVVYWIADIIGK